MFLNLALNALQAMPGGGELHIATGLARDEGALWRDAPRRSELVEIRFGDSGPGIPAAEREHVFVPFFTTKEKGTGLGLAICQRIVKSHGGSIAVRTSGQGGAEFVITLPALREERDVPPRAPRRGAANRPPEPAAPRGAAPGLREGARPAAGAPRRRLC